LSIVEYERDKLNFRLFPSYAAGISAACRCWSSRLDTDERKEVAPEKDTQQEQNHRAA
jgi:hypothetical protein